MSTFKGKSVHVPIGVPTKLIDNNPNRVFLRVKNSSAIAASVKLDGTSGNVGQNSALLHPGESLDLRMQSADIEIWCLADAATDISIIEVVDNP